ncbi:MAG: SDR family oxidoreductase [Candidatus Heimdallarchaeota archaeon]|nr:SDR family oxidoreductase [Candidatus Heimdallarchaeota archaeon]
MKILVTGAGGYIGSTLVPLLLENKHEVLALDRFHFGRDKLPKNGKLYCLEADIRSVKRNQLESYGKIDAIIDLAALSNDPLGELEPSLTYSINHLGRVRMAMLCKSLGVDRYILPSSCSIYGFQEGEVTEESAVNPLTVYAKANYRCEQDVLAMADEDFCVTVIRQATVYGLSRRMRFDLAINGMTKSFYQNGKISIMRDGNQWRPFVHVKDTSKAMLLLLGAKPSKINRELFNIGSNDQNFQIYNLAERVAIGVGLDFNVEWYGDPDHRSYKVDFSKLKRITNFTADWNVEYAAKEIWDGIENNFVDPNDIQTITLKWYEKLIKDGITI